MNKKKHSFNFLLIFKGCIFLEGFAGVGAHLIIYFFYHKPFNLNLISFNLIGYQL